MEIVIPLRAKKKFKIGDQSYELSEPSVRQIEALQKRLDTADKSSHTSALVDMIVDLGLPKEVADQLGVSGLVIISEELTGASKKK